MSGFSTVGRDGEAIRPRRFEFHRTTDHLRAQGNHCRSLGEKTPASEGTTQVWGYDANVRRCDAQLVCEPVLVPVDILTRFPHRELAVLPGTGRGEQLHTVVMLSGRCIARIDFDRRFRVRTDRITDRRALLCLAHSVHAFIAYGE